MRIGLLSRRAVACTASLTIPGYGAPLRFEVGIFVSHDVLGTLLAVLAQEVESYCIADIWWSRADSDGGWSDVNPLRHPVEDV